MKNILIFAFLIICSFSFGQVNFQLFAYDACSNEVRRINNFGLKRGDRSFNHTDTCSLVLEDSGIYILSYVIERIDSSHLGKKYYIKSIGGDFSDTLRLLKIIPCIEPTTYPNFSGYCCCDEKCKGRQIDYYQNGNRRIEGNFVEGKPVGKLIFYHPNGSIQEVHKYSRKGRLRRKTIS